MLSKDAVIGQAKETDQSYSSKPSRHTDTPTDKDRARHRHENGCGSYLEVSPAQGRCLPGLAGRPVISHFQPALRRPGKASNHTVILYSCTVVRYAGASRPPPLPRLNLESDGNPLREMNAPSGFSWRTPGAGSLLMSLRHDGIKQQRVKRTRLSFVGAGSHPGPEMTPTQIMRRGKDHATPCSSASSISVHPGPPSRAIYQGHLTGRAGHGSVRNRQPRPTATSPTPLP